MKRNFIIGQSNELICNGRIYDLHNCFEFVSLSISVECTLKVVFEPKASHGAAYGRTHIEVRGVDYLEMSLNGGDKSIEGIDELGYKARGDRDDEWLMTESQASEDADLFIRFFGGRYLRFRGADALLNEIAGEHMVRDR